MCHPLKDNGGALVHRMVILSLCVDIFLVLVCMILMFQICILVFKAVGCVQTTIEDKCAGHVR